MKNIFYFKVFIILLLQSTVTAQSFYSFDLNPGSGSSAPFSLTVIEDKLLFGAYDSSIYGNSRLYISDGTAAGTYKISDLSPTHKPFVEYFNNCYFTGNDPVVGTELCKSNSTGTLIYMVYDAYWGSSSGMYSSLLTKNNGLIYFTAYDGIISKGLYTSDGTTVGTSLIKHLQGADFMISYNNKVYFGGRDTNDQNAGIWVSDGSFGGTNLFISENVVKATIADYCSIVYNGKLYFQGQDDVFKRQLWATDGTVGGTAMVVDITGGNHAVYGSEPRNFKVYNNRLYMQAGDNVNGTQVWSTDGTVPGTQMLKNINSPSGCMPDLFTVCNNMMYFIANDGTHGQELWITDGTEVGTHLVKDIAPGPYTGSNPHLLTEYHNKLYFVANDGNTGDQLWVSDGTESGTHILQPSNMYIGQFLTNCNGMTVYNNRLYYNAAYNSIGDELWAFDDTPTSVNDIEANNIQVQIYPNPAVKELYVNLNSTVTGTYDVELYNTYGQKVFQLKETSNAFVINTESLAKGIYLVRISNDDFYYSSRFVKA